MPRQLLGIFMLLLVSVSPLRAQGDVVLFTVGDVAVGLKEFEYHFGTSSEKRPDVFVQTLVRFKQKVLGARELGLDTLDAYRHRKEYFQQALVRREVRTKENSQYPIPAKEWIKLAHVTYPLPQNVSKAEERRALASMDSLYAALVANQPLPFQSLPWTQTRFLLNEWQKQLEGLDRGQYSRPFSSPEGVHIIVWTDRRMIEAKDKDVLMETGDFRMKQVEEGLLVASLEDYLENTVVCTSPELEAYFRLHKEEYGWGTPHYKGAVIHCKNKKEAKRIKAYLKKYPEELWQEAWMRMPEEVSEGGVMDTGLFAIGANPYIDKLVFKCGAYDVNPDFPYVWVFGKKMKKGPESYKDVSGKVEKNFRKAKKEADMEALIQKYRVEIDEEVLKTVNRCGNK